MSASPQFENAYHWSNWGFIWNTNDSMPVWELTEALGNALVITNDL